MKYKTELKWGAIFFVITISWIVFEKMMGWHGPNIAEHANYSIIYDALFIAVYVLAFWNKKRLAGLNGLSWPKGFQFGMIITGVITLLSPLVQTIFHRIISPEFFPNIIALAVKYNLLTLTEAQQKFNLGNYVVENIIGTFGLGFLCSLVLAFVFKSNKKAQVNEAGSV